MAIRDNRIAAESVGINVTKYKLMAFVTSAALAGMAGALYAHELFHHRTASKFDFNTSILILVFVVLGGMGNIRGCIIAATVLTILPEAAACLQRLPYAGLCHCADPGDAGYQQPHPPELVGRLGTRCTAVFWKKGAPKQRRQGMAAQTSKMVPVPSDSIIPERDLDKTPVLEAQPSGH